MFMVAVGSTKMLVQAGGWLQVRYLKRPAPLVGRLIPLSMSCNKIDG